MSIDCDLKIPTDRRALRSSASTEGEAELVEAITEAVVDATEQNSRRAGLVKKHKE